MKFTEEQYQKIVDAWNSKLMYENATKDVMNSLETIYINMREEALALANPVTREWAHDKFVEKKYVWSSKNNLNGYRTRLFIGENGIVTSYAYFDTSDATFNEQLTESEIEAWGYNPEMFDREEV